MSRKRAFLVVLLLALPVFMVAGGTAAMYLIPWLASDFETLQRTIGFASIASVAVAVGLSVTRKKSEKTANEERTPETSEDDVNPEAYDTLRAPLVNALRQDGVRSISIVSASPAEGRSTTAINIATSLARARKKVVLVDADLRRPVLQQRFGLKPGRGLTQVLAGECTLSDAIQPTGLADLCLLPAGVDPGSALDLLSSDKMSQILNDLKAVADVVIADTSAVSDSCGAFLVAPCTEASLQVVRPGRQDLAVQERMRTEFERSGVKVLGVVVNDADGLLEINGRKRKD